MQTNLFGGTSAATTTGAITSAMGGSETKNMFTTLLVAQIQNQNPLEPTDSTQFINQLTQLSQTEALQTLTSQNANNLNMLEGLQVLTLGAQVGNEVMVASNQVSLTDQTVNGAFTLAGASTQTAVVLTGPDGRQHRMELGMRPAGDVAFQIQPSQWGLPAGDYRIDIETSQGETPSVEVAGILESVRMSGAGHLLLQVANLGQVSANVITRFNGRTAP